MGLVLSVWLCNRLNPSPPNSSSTFPLLAVPTSSRLAITLKAPPVAPDDECSRWSSVHRSPNFLLSPCKREVMRLPVERSSDGARAETGVKSGLHVWEVMWNPNLRGSHAVLGISRQNCPLQASGYDVLIGGDSESWGWELRTNQLWHAGEQLRLYPERQGSCNCEHTERYGLKANTKIAQSPLPIPERILLVLDVDAGTLGFSVDGSFLGVAFKDLPSGVELFPAVSSVRGGASIWLRYLNGAKREWLFTWICFISIKGKLTFSFHPRGSSCPDGFMCSVYSTSLRETKAPSNVQFASTNPSPAVSPVYLHMKTPANNWKYFEKNTELCKKQEFFLYKYLYGIVFIVLIAHYVSDYIYVM